MVKAATFDNNVLIHDVRVEGKAPNYLAKNYWQIDGGASLDWIFGEALKIADSLPEKKIINIYVIAHGMYEQKMIWRYDSLHLNKDGKPTATPERCGAFHGGIGVQLGADNLTISSMDKIPNFLKLKDRVGKIIFYSCGIAGGMPMITGSKNDGSIDYIEDSEKTAQKETECHIHDGLTAYDRLNGLTYSLDSSMILPTFQFMKTVSKKLNTVTIGANMLQWPVLKNGWSNKTKMIYMEKWKGQLYEFLPPEGREHEIHRPGNDYF
ncbi:hypothetical protein [Niabella ginsengisoli]|uniref:Uncharacterized protein n=1 Tax=Niabella ginsengisoli TaxID=522298 RepID=A0ABS9SGT0_9BACT|nr:hypothetical protein [Niabella ginsengisoli]MCH5597557.1 hypothetical protein [Niabella ginsengisoli]